MRFFASIILVLVAGIVSHGDAQTPQQSQAKGIFALKPLLFTVGENQINLAWQYNTAPVSQSEVTVDLELPGKGHTSVTPTLSQGIYYAVLPLTCGFKGARYRVPGMASPLNVQDVPCADTKQPVKFSLIADAQRRPWLAKKIADLAAKFDGSVLISAGDLVQLGTSVKDWYAHFDAISSLNSQRVLVPALGNHEYYYEGTAALWQHFFKKEAAKSYYTYDIGPARIFIINSNFEKAPHLMEDELAWLVRSLEATPANKWKLVAMHHPPYSAANIRHPKGEAKGPDEPAEAVEAEALEAQDEKSELGIDEYDLLQKHFVPVFEKYKVEFVLAGHRHIFERSKKDGVNYINAGPAGGTFFMPVVHNPFAVIHARRERTLTNFTIEGDKARVVTVNIDGKVLDDFTVNRAAQ